MHENREISGASRSDQDRDRSAKALSHKAGMHVPEKSDRAEVPMNQPNKGEQSSAEVAEGRARIKENIVPSYTSPTHGRKTHVLTCWWRRRRPAPHDNRVFATLGSYEWCGCAWI